MTTARQRSYLFALVDGGGTVPPELGAVGRLVERGHRVEVLAEDTMLEEVIATGASFRPWLHAINRPGLGPEYDPVQDWQCRTSRELFTRMLDRLLACRCGSALRVRCGCTHREPPSRSSSLLDVRHRYHGGC
jgi:hypothetical protein